MPLRFFAVFIGIFILLFVIKAMLPKKFIADQLHFWMEEPKDPRKVLVDQLRLSMYEAFVTGDLSLCQEDGKCLQRVKTLKSWVYAAGACDGADKSKQTIEGILPTVYKYPQEIKDQINALSCSLIKYPSSETRRKLLTYAPKINEAYWVEYGAYLLALKRSAGACEDYIKNYINADGYEFKYKWYRILSGCRILAGERTREQEEKDFYTWFGVAQGLSQCSDIINSQMREWCRAPGPVPSIR